jgi:hypothetical protein
MALVVELRREALTPLKLGQRIHGVHLYDTAPTP